MSDSELSPSSPADRNIFARNFTARFGRAPRIGLVCHSAIADDPRVRRQGNLFQTAGWDVFAIGLKDSLSPPPTWPIYSVESQPEPDEMPHRTAQARSAIKSMLAGGSASHAAKAVFSLLCDDRVAALWLVRHALRSVEGALATFVPRQADRIYWRRHADYKQLLAIGQSQVADLWLGSDWTSLPIVRRLAFYAGVPYGYDAHEFAIDEYAHDRRWRLLHRPVVHAIERQGARDAALVLCVSEGIAKRLMQTHELSIMPTVVRNMPAYEEHPFRAPQEPIRVLYHGLVSPGRGLEACIGALSLLPSSMTLTIRGPADPDYRVSLERLALSSDVADRIIFDDPVPMVDLVARANDFDIGLFALPGHSQQNIHVLPNKFFEYVMAGLALCVSDLPEMTQFVRAYHLGETIERAEPHTIAAALARLDTETIETAKRASLRAARELCWETEAHKLLSLAECAVEQSPHLKISAGCCSPIPPARNSHQRAPF